jgi:hypothetical protein
MRPQSWLPDQHVVVAWCCSSIMMVVIVIGQGAVRDDKEYRQNSNLLHSLVPCYCFLMGLATKIDSHTW